MVYTLNRNQTERWLIMAAWRWLNAVGKYPHGDCFVVRQGQADEGDGDADGDGNVLERFYQTFS